MEAAFQAFSKFGDTKSDGKTLTLTQSDKWMKQAKVIDGKTITTTDTAICFNKLKQKTLNFSDYNKFLNDLASYKKVPVDEIINKMVSCGAPGLAAGATKTTSVGAVDRLTDTSKYTGSHKERFDESGKGKGKEGREDLHDDQGYVGAYKGKDTYDKTH